MFYTILNNMIIFECDFNFVQEKDIFNILLNVNIIYFKNYNYNDYDYDICIETNNNYNVQYNFIGSQFNQPIDNLPISIQNLTLGYMFNQLINNLPNSIQIKKDKCNKTLY